MQIPQVMREFVTRGAWAIQEWEPDRGPELEKQPRPASEGSGCRAGSSGRGEDSRMEPSGLGVERAPASLFLGERRQTLGQVVETRWPSVLVHTWCLRGNDEQGPSGSALWFG